MKRIRLLCVLAAGMLFAGCGRVPRNALPVGRQPVIYPDYRGVTIPPTIAPLNFFVQEPGRAFCARITGRTGASIEVRSGDGRMCIPIGSWRRFLAGNRGANASVCVFTRDSAWKKYQEFSFAVSADTIDPWVVYRAINICVKWKNMAIVQRDLRSFAARPVLHNTHVNNACLNCHSFRNGDGATMLLQMRHPGVGTPMFVSGENGRGPRAINARTPHSHGKAGFTAWHPTLPIIAFSLNEFSLLIHTGARETREVFDNGADVALYDASSGAISGNPAFCDPHRIETMPSWSPDGAFLYFCSAPRLPQADFASVKSGIMRIAFDPSSGAWGTLDTILTAEQAGGSVTGPRPSPDGRFILVNISNYSVFPVHQERCDLALYGIADRSLRRLPGAANRNRSWHSWSRNSRWIAFSSKELDGRFGRIWLCHIDSAGNAANAFPIPQKDPLAYASMISTNNLPELLCSPVRLTARDFNAALRRFDRCTEVQGTTGATAKTNPPATPSPSEATHAPGKPFD